MAEFLHEDNDVEDRNANAIYGFSDGDDSDVYFEDFIERSEFDARRMEEWESEDDGDGDEDEDVPPSPSPWTAWTNVLGNFAGVEPFTAKSGPTFDAPENGTALDYFSLLFGDDLFEMIGVETNRYARQKLEGTPGLTSWQDVTLPEIKVYTGLRILMGVIRLPELKVYWSRNSFYGSITKMFPKIMKWKRFVQITRYLHFNNSTSKPPFGHPARDRLHKVRPVIEYLVEKFQSKYYPTMNISVATRMVPFRGSASFCPDIMPRGLSKDGIKVWAAADTSNGYVLNFDVDVDELEDQIDHRSRHTLGFDVVTSMAGPYLGKNHHLYFNKAFTTPALLDHLLQQKTYACAAVSLSDTNLPACAKTVKRKKDGQIVRRQCGNVLFTKWHIHGNANLLSTNCSPFAPHTPVRPKLRKGKYIYSPEPAVVTLYNDSILLDPLEKWFSYYPTARPSRTWYRYIFWFVVDLAIYNAEVLKAEVLGKQQQQMDFRCELGEQLIGGLPDINTWAEEENQ